MPRGRRPRRGRKAEARRSGAAAAATAASVAAAAAQAAVALPTRARPRRGRELGSRDLGSGRGEGRWGHAERWRKTAVQGRGLQGGQIGGMSVGLPRAGRKVLHFSQDEGQKQSKNTATVEASAEGTMAPPSTGPDAPPPPPAYAQPPTLPPPKRGDQTAPHQTPSHHSRPTRGQQTPPPAAPRPASS